LELLLYFGNDKIRKAGVELEDVFKGNLLLNKNIKVDMVDLMFKNEIKHHPSLSPVARRRRKGDEVQCENKK
jgi:hypothetical protein